MASKKSSSSSSSSAATGAVAGAPAVSTPNNKRKTQPSSASAKALEMQSERAVVRTKVSKGKIREYIEKNSSLREIGLDKLLSSNDKWTEFLTKQENFMEELGINYLKWSRGFLGDFSLQEAVGQGRTKSEGKSGGNTQNQNKHTNTSFDPRARERVSINIDAYKNETFNYKLRHNNFVDNDKNICWLCSKPLFVNPKVTTPQSEHKPPCMSMALLGTGLALTEKKKQTHSQDANPQQNQYPNQNFVEFQLQQTDGGLQTPNLNTDKYILYQDWKLLVRAESMAWSHPWCNNIKSQTPFISLRYGYKNNKGSGSSAAGKELKFMYVIEENAINEFIKKLNPPKPKKGGQREVMNYPEESEDVSGIDKDFFGTKLLSEVSSSSSSAVSSSSSSAVSSSSSSSENSNRKKWEKMAKRNIIIGLIPLWCLLNQGFNIFENVKDFCEKLLSSSKTGNNRTFSNILNGNPACSIENRVKQNCARMVARGAALSESIVYKIGMEEDGSLLEQVKKLIDSFYGKYSDKVLGFDVDAEHKEIIENTVQAESELSASAAAEIRDSNNVSKARRRLVTVQENEEEEATPAAGAAAAKKKRKVAAGKKKTEKKGGRRKTKRKKKRKKKTKRKRKRKKKTKRRRKKKNKTRRRR